MWFLVVANVPFQDHTVADLPEILQPDDVLIVNDTRVIAAELQGTRTRGGVSAGVLPTFSSAWTTRHGASCCVCQKIRIGDQIVFTGHDGSAGDPASCVADVIDKAEGGVLTLRFDRSGEELTGTLDAIGRMPLPPYIGTRRQQDGQDVKDYQTIFAQRAGAVAAPTAGLHFTDALLKALADRGITREVVTLHVGGGTFLPVKAEDTTDHKMHSEWGR